MSKQEAPSVSWGDTSSVESTASSMNRSMFNMKDYLLGRVLTIVDASISDQEQRKAMKDVVKDAFRSREFHSTEVLHLFFQFAKATTEQEDSWFRNNERPEEIRPYEE